MSSLVLAALLLCPLASKAAPLAEGTTAVAQQGAAPEAHPIAITGFRDAARQRKWEELFLSVPDPKRAEAHLRRLTEAPHVSGSPESRKVAEYIAEQFRAAGLETELVEYRIYMNLPKRVAVYTVAGDTVTLIGPDPEQVAGDPFQSDPRVLPAFNGYSPSGTVEAEVVYANYGQPEDFDQLEEMGVDVRGKIVLVRYGKNFRGVKAYVAEERGAAGVIIYSDPMDDGYFKGDPYPKGPWRPQSGVQRGSILYIFQYPGDPTTPGVASAPSLPMEKRVAPEEAESLPRIPTTPLAWQDARIIMQGLGGPESPREWQGAMPLTYHVGPGPMKVRMELEQEYSYRSLWDVIGRIRGSTWPDEQVLGGNHHDAWVYGAVDPNSGTTAVLEAVRGLGKLLEAGWKPRRSIVIGEWAGEEQGLIGSTEWAEQNAGKLAGAVAYFNIDAAVSGPDFEASAVPSLKEFVREASKAVSSPKGETVFQQWLKQPEKEHDPDRPPEEKEEDKEELPKVGNLGSGSDYTPFLQHLGIPATDVRSSGSYGVYHSVFDNFEWFRRFADPDFAYEQQMARLWGLQLLRMAGADVLPYDYGAYGKAIVRYLEKARDKAKEKFEEEAPSFDAALEAANAMAAAGEALKETQAEPPADPARLNQALRAAERALLLPEGLPNRPWFRHAIYAPGQYTGYAAVEIPGVNEAIDAGDRVRAGQQLDALRAALERAAKVLASYGRDQEAEVQEHSSAR